MKLMRVGAPGRERPALKAADGTLRDLAGIVADIAGEVLTTRGSPTRCAASILGSYRRCLRPCALGPRSQKWAR